jgi:hypothetical protein
MTGLENIAGKVGKEVGKELVAKSDGLIKILFENSAIKELGGVLTDNIRYRRLQNQIAILEKVKALVEEHNMKLKDVNLKVMLPLLNYSSLEENPDLQTKWAKLIKNILTISIQEVLQQKAIEILSKMSNEDAKTMDFLFDYFGKSPVRDNPLLTIQIDNIATFVNLDSDIVSLVVSNLVSLGLIKYVVSGSGKGDANGASVTVRSIKIDDDSKIRMTRIGFEIMKLFNA